MPQKLTKQSKLPKKHTYPPDLELSIIKSKLLIEGLVQIYAEFSSLFSISEFNHLASCLIFGHEYAGSAVCIHSSGIILTCAHCLEHEDESNGKVGDEKLLIFINGMIVNTKCIVINYQYDLALLQIIGIYTTNNIPLSNTLLSSSSMEQSKQTITKQEVNKNQENSIFTSSSLSLSTLTTTPDTLFSILQSQYELPSYSTFSALFTDDLDNPKTNRRKVIRHIRSNNVINTYQYIPITTNNFVFPYLSILPMHYYPIPKQICYCVGQPGQDDLESNVSRNTGYPFVYGSKGKYLGIINDDIEEHPKVKKFKTAKTPSVTTISTIDIEKNMKNIMNNFDIGQLRHNCWTYWGHSGAPIFVPISNTTNTVSSTSITTSTSTSNTNTNNTDTLMLIGLHSSWDDQTGTRHGIHIEAIRRFIIESIPLYPSLSLINLTSTSEGSILHKFYYSVPSKFEPNINKNKLTKKRSRNVINDSSDSE